MMSPQENLYYAMGEIAYCIARADGKVQKEEHKRFQEIVETGLKRNGTSFDVAGIIFQILGKEKISAELSYEWAMKQIHTNSHYLSPELKKCFIDVAEDIARAFPPIHHKEDLFINKFRKDIAPLKGDPVYYGKNA